MRVLVREWFDVARSDVFTIDPIGDIHTGNAACDEQRLRSTVADIAARDNAYWVGLGDYAEFITMKDWRFRPESLATWVGIPELVDLAAEQRDRFCGIVEPIAHKCLGLVRGNHEATIHRHTERDIYAEIVCAVKKAGGHPADYPLALGSGGWIVLKFYRSQRRAGACVLRTRWHHGWSSGRLAGATALNLERWLWNNDCDLAVFGHSHKVQVHVAAVNRVTTSGKPWVHVRYGAVSGSYMAQADYAEDKGYFAQPVASVQAILQPGNADENRRVHVVTT